MSVRPIYLTIVSVKLFFKLLFMLVKLNQNLEKLTYFPRAFCEKVTVCNSAKQITCTTLRHSKNKAQMFLYVFICRYIFLYVLISSMFLYDLLCSYMFFFVPIRFLHVLIYSYIFSYMASTGLSL